MDRGMCQWMKAKWKMIKIHILPHYRGLLLDTVALKQKMCTRAKLSLSQVSVGTKEGLSPASRPAAEDQCWRSQRCPLLEIRLLVVGTEIKLVNFIPNSLETPLFSTRRLSDKSQQRLFKQCVRAPWCDAEEFCNWIIFGFKNIILAHDEWDFDLVQSLKIFCCLIK